MPGKPISVSSVKAPFWYIRGLWVNCARSMRENIIVSSNLTRTERMRSNDNGSSPVMKLREGIFPNGGGLRAINRLVYNSQCSYCVHNRWLCDMFHALSSHTRNKPGHCNGSALNISADLLNPYSACRRRLSSADIYAVEEQEYGSQS